MQNETLVREIIKSGTKLSLVIAGGGAEVIGELLRHGGASSLLLDVQVPYCQTAFDKYLGGKPDQYCSASVTADLAMQAWIRGTHLQQKSPDRVIGFAATSSLVKPDGEREGRHHHVHLAQQTGFFTRTQSFEFLHQGQSRENEEAAVSTLILNELALCCIHEKEFSSLKIPEFVNQGKCRNETVTEDIRKLTLQTNMRNFHEIILNDHPKMLRAIYAGSFNPLHDGHLGVAEHFFKKSGIPVDFEISLHNVDKPTLNFITLEDRIQQFYQESPQNRFMGNLLLTTTPYFRDKATLFPNSYFLMGDDTLARLIDPQYYSDKHKEGEEKMEETFRHFVKKGAKLVSYPRKIKLERPLPILHRMPDWMRQNLILIPTTEYEGTSHSSSAIRKEKNYE